MQYFTKLCTVGLILILGFSSQAKGQGYESIFGDSSTAWKSEFIGSLYAFIDSIYCKTQDTTVIDGKSYRKIYSTFVIKKTPDSVGYLREDTTKGKLWYRGQRDTAEKLIYDLSLTEQDSFFVPNMNNKYGEDRPGWTKVDSVYYDDNDNKVITFNLRQVNLADLPLKFIEGRGPTHGFEYKSNSSSKGGEILICQIKSMQQAPYIFDKDFYNKCPKKQVTGLKEAKNNLSEEIELFPNPTFNYIKIKVANHSDLNLTLYDQYGKIIESVKIQHARKIKTKSLKEGLYLYRISNQNNEIIKTGKLMKQ